MQKKLHPVVLTVAILQVVFGLLVLGCDGFGVINAYGFEKMAESPGNRGPGIQKDGRAGQTKDPGAAFNQGFEAGASAQITVIEKVPSYLPALYFQSFFGLFLGFLMVLSGIGLFFMQSWARWLAVVYGVFSLMARLAFVVYHATVVLPVLNEISNNYVRNGQPQMAQALVGLKAMPFTGLVLALYPLLVIGCLLMPPVHKAFRGKPARRRGFDDARDPDWNEEEWERP
jgi:hypothetical protein